jgi:DNA replication protein DnaC
MKAPTLNPELIKALKALRLGPIADTLPDRLVLADTQQMSFEDVFLLLLTDEINRRQSSAAARRADLAGLDSDLVLERWDKTAKVRFDKRVFQELTSLRFIEAPRNVVILGQVGVGKTFVASALGHLACKSGFNVRFVRADVLLARLKQSRFDNSRDAVLTDLCAVDLLIIDDFALEPMGREESRDVYQLFVERNARTSTLVTSNRDTNEWLAMFDDTLLAQSAVDRFANNAYDLVIEGESYRPRLKPNIETSGPPPEAPIQKQHTHPRRRPKPKAT